MEQFFTRERANDGVKIPLNLPDGKPSDYWLVIRGVDSDTFRAKEADVNRQILTFKKEDLSDKGVFRDLQLEMEVELLSSLVKEWNFDEELTEENVKKLLRNAPQIAKAINNIAADRKRFLTQSSKVSTSTPEVPSSSAAPQSPKQEKVQKSQEGNT